MTHLNELLAPRVACVELYRSEPFELCNQVCTCRLSDARRTGNQDSTRGAHTVLSGFLEARFETARPIVQPQPQFLDLTLVPAHLFECAWGVAVRPELAGERDGAVMRKVRDRMGAG